MITKVRWLALLLSLVLVLPARPAGLALAQADGQVFFPETGHWVRDEFLETYRRVESPLLVYGYPITEAFPERQTGLTVQYFQKARFELHPEAIPELRVQLSPLGEFLYTPASPLPIPDYFPACRQYPETGYQVCYAFLEFFDNYGGVAQFGYPISNFEHHDERIVQYFQRARLEWRPENLPGQRVALTDLGARYFNVKGESPILLLPDLDNTLLLTTLELRVRAFPGQAVTGRRAEQTVYVIVQDQNLRPVPNAHVEISVTQVQGKAERSLLGRTTLPPTDDQGVTQVTFPVNTAGIGIARIKVTATHDTLREETITSFRVWW